jgi:beta-lactamase class D
MELGRRIGPERLQAYVDAFDYGNRRASGDYPYWIEGDLRISPYEQLAFLRKVQSDALPIAPSAHATLRRVMLNERRGDRALYAKTGLSADPNAGAAWRVGFIEDPRRTVIFSVSFWPLNADLRAALERRTRVVKAFLAAAADWR